MTFDALPKIPSLWSALSDSFQTDLPLEQVVNLAYVGVKIEPHYILSQSVGRGQVRSWRTPQGAAVLVPVEDKLRKMLESFYAPLSIESLDAATGIRVQIDNGSKRAEAEELAAALLGWHGLEVVGTGLAERRNFGQTEIRVFNDDLASGEQVAGYLRVPKSAVRDHDLSSGSNGADIHIILGKDYDPCQK
jgi:hypothetical protein